MLSNNLSRDFLFICLNWPRKNVVDRNFIIFQYSLQSRFIYCVLIHLYFHGTVRAFLSDRYAKEYSTGVLVGKEKGNFNRHVFELQKKKRNNQRNVFASVKMERSHHSLVQNFLFILFFLVVNKLYLSSTFKRIFHFLK